MRTVRVKRGAASRQEIPAPSGIDPISTSSPELFERPTNRRAVADCPRRRVTGARNIAVDHEEYPVVPGEIPAQQQMRRRARPRCERGEASSNTTAILSALLADPAPRSDERQAERLATATRSSSMPSSQRWLSSVQSAPDRWNERTLASRSVMKNSRRELARFLILAPDQTLRECLRWRVVGTSRRPQSRPRCLSSRPHRQGRSRVP